MSKTSEYILKKIQEAKKKRLKKLDLSDLRLEEVPLKYLNSSSWKRWI